MTESYEIIKMLALGLAAGVLSGLFGIGGGLVIVPALAVLFGFPIKTAVGTSLFALLLPTGLLGAIEYWKSGNMKPVAGLCIALGLFIGAYFGARYAVRLPQAGVKRLYAVFLLVVAGYFLVSPTRPSSRRVEAAAGAASSTVPPPPGAVGGAPAAEAP